MKRYKPMFKFLVCVSTVLLAFETNAAQEAANTASMPEISSSYVVQLTEYRLAQPLTPAQSAEEILALVGANGGNPQGAAVETIRLSTVGGMESMAQFGQRANVTAGKTTTNRGESVRNIQAIDVGTMVKVTIVPRNDQVAMMLTFESSKIGSDADEESPPSIAKTLIRTTQLLELGKPNLVGGSTTSSSSVIIVTVNQK